MLSLKIQYIILGRIADTDYNRSCAILNLLMYITIFKHLVLFMKKEKKLINCNRKSTSTNITTVMYMLS